MNRQNTRLVNLLYPLWEKYNSVKSHVLSYPKSGNGFSAIPREKMIQYNKVRFFGAKKHFCYNPFMNLYFNTSGHAIACCRSHHNVLGTYPNQSISEIWFGSKANKLREHLLHNDLSMGCDYCRARIDANRFHSLPSIHAEKYGSKTVTSYPGIIELELGNTCNLLCVMCTGRVSSSIRQHRENLEPFTSPYDMDFVDQLKEFIPHVKEMSFYGGEPFLISLYYPIWEAIIEINPKIQLRAVSNGTVYNERIEKIIKATRFDLTISLDSLKKDQFESIRVGSDFEKVMTNIRKFEKICSGPICISHTPMLLNYQETPDIIQFCNDNNYFINLSYVEKPAEYALWSFHPSELDDIYRYYCEVQWCKTKNRFIEHHNIMVFNEWKEQVKYFRDKNAAILQSFGDIEKEYELLMPQLNQVFWDFFEQVPPGWLQFNQAMAMITETIDRTAITPVTIEGIRQLLTHFADSSVIQSEIAGEFLRDEIRFRDYINDVFTPHRFWSRYY